MAPATGPVTATAAVCLALAGGLGFWGRNEAPTADVQVAVVPAPEIVPASEIPVVQEEQYSSEEVESWQGETTPQETAGLIAASLCFCVFLAVVVTVLLCKRCAKRRRMQIQHRSPKELGLAKSSAKPLCSKPPSLRGDRQPSVWGSATSKLTFFEPQQPELQQPSAEDIEDEFPAVVPASTALKHEEMDYTVEQQEQSGMDEHDKLDATPEDQQRSNIGPAWTRGEIEAPVGVKDMGSWSERVYNPEQQRRLGIDEHGNFHAEAGGHEASTFGTDRTGEEVEAHPDAHDMDFEAARVYTTEEQLHDGLKEDGNHVDLNKAHDDSLGPAWTRGEIEEPVGVKDMGSWSERVYNPEQQQRLGIDEHGRILDEAGGHEDSTFGAGRTGEEVEARPNAHDMDFGAARVHTTEEHHVGSLGPAWTRGEMEAPEGVKDMGSWSERVYTVEQQRRLAVDEHGNYLTEAGGHEASTCTAGKAVDEVEAPADAHNMGFLAASEYTKEEQLQDVPDGLSEDSNLTDLSGEIEAPADVKAYFGEDGLIKWSERVYTLEQQQRLGVDKNGNPVTASGEHEDSHLGLWCGQEEIEARAAEEDIGTFVPAACTPEQLPQQQHVNAHEDSVPSALGDDSILEDCDGLLSDMHQMEQKLEKPKANKKQPQFEEIEPPAGVKEDMGGRSVLVYTLDQQQRLGVNEWGVFIEVDEPELPVSEATGVSELASEGVMAAENMDENYVLQVAKQTGVEPTKEETQRSPVPLSPSPLKQLQHSPSPLSHSYGQHSPVPLSPAYGHPQQGRRNSV